MNPLETPSPEFQFMIRRAALGAVLCLSGSSVAAQLTPPAPAAKATKAPGVKAAAKPAPAVAPVQPPAPTPPPAPAPAEPPVAEAAPVPAVPAPITLDEAPKFPLGMSVSDFTATTSALEVSVPERGRRRFEINPSSLWDGVQSATLDFVDNRLAVVTLTMASDPGWTAFISSPVAKRGQPQDWKTLTGTTLYDRRVIEDSVAWLGDAAVVAYLREASSSGNRNMVVLMSRERFDAMKRDELFPGAARQMITLNLGSVAFLRAEVQYTRAIGPSLAWLVGLEALEGTWPLRSIGERLAGDWAPSPVFGANAGIQWYPTSGGAPKGFYLEARARLAITSAGYYSGVGGKVGYNFLFANGLAVGVSAGANYMPDRQAPILPIGSLDIGWAF
jgi:hypothetical protein